MDTGRKTAFEILLEIETSAAYSNLSINKFIQRNAPPDPAFVRELVYGVLENRLLLDYYLDKLIASGISRTGRRERTLLRLGLYQLIGMESVPEYAAVNETVALARRLADEGAPATAACRQAAAESGFAKSEIYRQLTAEKEG